MPGSSPTCASREAAAASSCREVGARSCRPARRRRCARQGCQGGRRPWRQRRREERACSAAACRAQPCERADAGVCAQPNLLVRALEPAKLSGDAPSAEQLQADSARAKAYSRQKARGRGCRLRLDTRLTAAARLRGALTPPVRRADGAAPRDAGGSGRQAAAAHGCPRGAAGGVGRAAAARAGRPALTCGVAPGAQDLRAAAQEPDFTPFPARRTIPMETPPVPHYFEKLRAAAEEVVSSSALGGGKRR